MSVSLSPRLFYSTHTHLRANEKIWRNVVWEFKKKKNTKSHRFVHLKS